MTAGTNPGHLYVAARDACLRKGSPIELPKIKMRTPALSIMNGSRGVAELSRHLLSHLKTAGADRWPNAYSNARWLGGGVIAQRRDGALRYANGGASPPSVGHRDRLSLCVPEEEWNAVSESLHQQVAGGGREENVGTCGRGRVGGTGIDDKDPVAMDLGRGDEAFGGEAEGRREAGTVFGNAFGDVAYRAAEVEARVGSCADSTCSRGHAVTDGRIQERRERIEG